MHARRWSVDRLDTMEKSLPDTPRTSLSIAERKGNRWTLSSLDVCSFRREIRHPRTYCSLYLVALLRYVHMEEFRVRSSHVCPRRRLRRATLIMRYARLWSTMQLL